jgi:predicted nucleotidyltransferase
VTVLAEASLTDNERRVLDRLADRLAKRFGERLRSVWLYGSRARGEKRGAESDVDLLVVLARRHWTDDGEVRRIVSDAAETEGANPVYFSTMVYDVARVAQRREIRSFFIQEVDRDKIVLYGDA